MNPVGSWLVFCLSCHSVGTACSGGLLPSTWPNPMSNCSFFVRGAIITLASDVLETVLERSGSKSKSIITESDDHSKYIYFLQRSGHGHKYLPVLGTVSVALGVGVELALSECSSA